MKHFSKIYILLLFCPCKTFFKNPGFGSFFLKKCVSKTQMMQLCLSLIFFNLLLKNYFFFGFVLWCLTNTFFKSLWSLTKYIFNNIYFPKILLVLKIFLNIFALCLCEIYSLICLYFWSMKKYF